MRHRLGRNTFRFIRETHLELPPQPPPARRTLVLFAHFDLQGIVDPYVAYYLKALHELGATIVFVSGSPTLTPESAASIRAFCAGIYTRRTLSLDFGSWHLAWCILRDSAAGRSISSTASSSPTTACSVRSFLSKRCGARSTMLTCTAPSKIARWCPTSKSSSWLGISTRAPAPSSTISDQFKYIVHKGTLIWRYEIGLSKRARKAGLSVKPFVPAATIKTTYVPSSTHLWASRRSGRNNGTLYCWDGLIEDFRFPFLKTILPRHNKPWQVSMAHLRDVIEQHTPYPYRLIQANVDRLGRRVPSLPTSVATPRAGGTF